MDLLSDVFARIAGAPTIIGLLLTAIVIFLTSDWRLSLTALLVQYILIGIAISDAVRLEVAVVKILVGGLAVSILYLTARRVQETDQALPVGSEKARFLGLSVGWEAGPLGLPLRFLAALLAVLAVLRLFGSLHLPSTSTPIAFAATWLGAMGLTGLVVSSSPLRVAVALLTILGAFDLVYARLQPSLAVAGFWSVLILLGALAFAYLATVQALSVGSQKASQGLPGTGDTEREA